MQKFLMEMHCHTAEVSPCARVSASDVIKKYANSDFNGIVITDHFTSYSHRRFNLKSWAECKEHVLSGYKIALNAAPDGFVVLPGMEISFDDSSNDYLVYGIDDKFFDELPEDVLAKGFNNFRDFAKEHNCLIFQAHPFRNNMQIVEPRFLDGIEVYNGNSSHNSNNDVAMQWADKYSLMKVSGSDFHEYWGMKPGGLIFNRPIKSNSDLIEALRANDYSLLK